MARIVDIILNFGIDPQKARQAAQDVERLDARIEALDRSVSDLNQTFGALEDISTRIGAAGVAIFAPLALSAGKYIDTVGSAEKQSREWLRTTEQLNKAQVDIGRKAVEALNPYRNALADILTKISQVDPAIIKAGVEIGGVLTLIGATGLLTAQVGRLISSSRELISGLAKLQAAGGLQGRLATGAVGIGALAVGTTIGINLVNAYGRSRGDERLASYGLEDAGRTLGQAVTILASMMVDAGVTVAKTFAYIEAILKLAGVKVEEGFAKVVTALEKAYLGVFKTFGELRIDLGERFGVDFGDINIGDKLGIDVDKINARLAELNTQSTEFSDRARQIGLDLEDTLETIDSNAAGLKEKIVLPLAEGLGLLEDTAEKQRDAAQGFASLTEEQQRALLDSFAQMQTDLADAQRDFNEAQQKDLDDFNAETLKLEENYQRQRTRATEEFERGRLEREKDFQRQQRQAEKDFYQQRQQDALDFARDQAEAAAEFEAEQRQERRDYERDEIRRLEDFQRQRERAEQDHRQRLLEAVGRLDATAVLQELQGFAREDRRAGEDFARERDENRRQLEERLAQSRAAFQTEQQERQRQYAESRARDLARFQEQQARQQEDFARSEQRQREQLERSRALQEEDFNRSLQERRRAFQIERAEAKRDFAEQQTARRAAFKQQYTDLVNFQNAESKARQTHYENLKRQLEVFLGAGKPIPRGRNFTLPTFQTGGYTGEGGPALLHRNEWVADAGTTRALERALGGRLTQENVRSMTDNSRHTSITAPITIQGGSGSPEAIGRAVRVELVRVLEAYNAS